MDFGTLYQATSPLRIFYHLQRSFPREQSLSVLLYSINKINHNILLVFPAFERDARQQNVDRFVNNFRDVDQPGNI